MKYFIRTFGCQQNISDSERLHAYYQARGYKPTDHFEDADIVILNTCMIRQKAEDKVYGFLENLKKRRQEGLSYKIIITGCLVGTAVRDTSGRALRALRRRLPMVDEFLPISEVGFEYYAIRSQSKHAWIPISNGCNNFCTYCIVPFSRGKEISRPYATIISEIRKLALSGYTEITLLGQNVNSYGNDLVKNAASYVLPGGRKIRPTMVKHLGKFRIPTLFPFLLEDICTIKGIQKVSFISANPWDFSAELISVIKHNKKIDRFIHLPVQSGDNAILKKMNRWYTRKQFLSLLDTIRKQIPDIRFTTDIIVGFPGETSKAFLNTVALAKKAKFAKAFIAMYSPRPFTVAQKKYPDIVHLAEKKRRFQILDQLINHQYTGYIPSWLRPAR